MVCTGTEGFALAGPLVEPHGFEVMGVGLGTGVLVTRVAGVHLIRHHGLVLASLGRRGSLYADGRDLPTRTTLKKVFFLSPLNIFLLNDKGLRFLSHLKSSSLNGI